MNTVPLNPFFGGAAAFLSLADASRWRKARQDYFDVARATRACLTDPNGYYRYAPDDIRVKAAVGAWVQRARNAHAFAMGSKPVIKKFVSITSAGISEGQLYAA